MHKLVDRFDEIATKVGLSTSEATNGLTPYQTIVSASLIQTEAKLAEDGPLISAVVVNRLRQAMPLQIDSTLCYAKGGCPPLPTNADKKIASPYNTYLNKGCRRRRSRASPRRPRGRAAPGGGAVPLLRRSPTRTGSTRSRRRSRSTTRTSPRRGPRACCDPGGPRLDPGRGHHRRSGRALPIPGDPQRRVRRARPRLGLRRVSRCAPGDGERGGPGDDDAAARGLNVTMPHKTRCRRACDELSATAAAIAVGQHRRRPRRCDLRGTRPTARASCAPLERTVASPAGRTCVVLGAGGAARADRPGPRRRGRPGRGRGPPGGRRGHRRRARARRRRGRVRRPRRRRGRPTSSSTPRRSACGARLRRSIPRSCTRASSSSTPCTTRPRRRSWPRPGPGASRPPTGSGCWSTRPPWPSSSGPAGSAPLAVMRDAARAENS